MHLHKFSSSLRSLSSSSSGSSSDDLLCLIHSSPCSLNSLPLPLVSPILCSPSLSSSGSSSDDLLCLIHSSPSSTNLGAVPGSPSSADEEGQVPRSSTLAAAAAGPAAKRARFTPMANDLQGDVAAALGGEGQGEEEEEQGAQEHQEDEEEEVGCGLMELALTALWDDAMSRGLFRYDLSSIETKSVPGRLRFVAQVWSFVWGFCVGHVGCMPGGPGCPRSPPFAPVEGPRGRATKNL